MSDEAVSAHQVYEETCSRIRATDDISFKLMGIVPLLSGTTFLAFSLKDGISAPISADSERVLFILSLFAALITLGLFRWELRNIQTCNWLRRRAEALEKFVVPEIQLREQPPRPLGFSKTQAEKLIYFWTVIAWLSIPIVICGFGTNAWLFGYIILAIVIAWFTFFSARCNVEVKLKSSDVIASRKMAETD